MWLQTDPLYCTRRLLVIADERFGDVARERVVALLAAGDPRGHEADAWQTKGLVRELYRGDPDVAVA